MLLFRKSSSLRVAVRALSTESLQLEKTMDAATDVGWEEGQAAQSETDVDASDGLKVSAGQSAQGEAEPSSLYVPAGQGLQV